jgi:NAD(P)-dependent dehydrogenase (short-subunit alcohol dehydrogenase family)
LNDFKGKVAVVTGAASGIGRAIADRCAQEGLKVVLADIERAALLEAESELKASGATVHAVVTDVSKSGDVEYLAKTAMELYGGVHLLFNNAGVGRGKRLWECTQADWEWTINVNLWGVIHGIRHFVPKMLEQKSECHVVNTASIAGLVAGPGMGIYRMTKHAVVNLSETLYAELQAAESRIGVSVLCPGFVQTRIIDSERNCPPQLMNPVSHDALKPGHRDKADGLRQAIAGGLDPREVAAQVFEAVRSGTFYILTHPEMKQGVQVRMEAILEGQNPPVENFV